MEPSVYITHSAEETFELACRIGEQLRGGEVFLLAGDLGAGKTVFAKGLGAGLDIDPAEVNSPTFTLVNAHEGRLRLHHLDLYRLSGDVGELTSLGLDEILDDASAVTVIEWSERLGEYRIPGACEVSIFDLGGDDRKIEIRENTEHTEHTE